MHMIVNKKNIVRRPVKYAALSSGTVSAVWYDDEQTAVTAQKRKNHIVLNREPAKKSITKPAYDA